MWELYMIQKLLRYLPILNPFQKDMFGNTKRCTPPVPRIMAHGNCIAHDKVDNTYKSPKQNYFAHQTRTIT